MRPLAVLGVLVVPLWMNACATGQVAQDLTTDETTVGSDAGPQTPDTGSGNNYGAGDSGKHPQPQDAGATNPDSGSTAIDSGSQPDSSQNVDAAPPPVDSAPPPVGDCTGTVSQQVSQINGSTITYDDACDIYYGNTFGGSQPCTPGANNCAALNGTGGIATYCCYKPASANTACGQDYGGDPQCVPN